MTKCLFFLYILVILLLSYFVYLVVKRNIYGKKVSIFLAIKNKGGYMEKIKKSFLGKTFAILFAGVIAMLLCCNQKTINEVNAVALSGTGVTDVFAVGEFKTYDDAHTIKIDADGGILFDDTYALTANEDSGIYTLTGKLGSGNTDVKFARVNKSAILCVSHIKYTQDETTHVLYANTLFVTDYVSTENADGGIELWRGDAKVATYGDFQSAFTSANNGDVIKLTKNMAIQDGSALVGKNVTIEGNNYTLDKSSFGSTVFAVAENATLTINNLNIDGGATGWAVQPLDFTKEINLVTGSADSDPKTAYSIVSTAGKFVANNFNVSNTFSTNTTGVVINLAKGELEIKNSKFIHNASTNGGVLRVGYDILESELTDYAVKKISFEDIEFKNNFASSEGGVLYGQNIKDMVIENCEFDSNVAKGNDGGAFCIRGDGYSASAGWGSTAHKLGLDYGKLKVNNSTFNNNICRNDGFAFDTEDSECTITNCIFTGNVGWMHTGGSVGTVSFIMERFNYRFAEHLIENCTFKNNDGAVSCVGDHAGTSDVTLKNCEFEGNKGNCSMLFYTSVVDIDACSFKNEQASTCVIDTRVYYASSYYEKTEKKTALINIKDTTFEGSSCEFDIWLRSKSHSDTTLVDPKLCVQGETSANVGVYHESELNIEGTLNGNVIMDEVTPVDKISVGKDGNLEGTISVKLPEFNVTFKYLDELDADQQKVLSLIKDKTYSVNDIQELLEISIDGKVLKFYTNNTYTTAWDYTIDKAETVYGQWEEHTHAHNIYAVVDNAIVKMCECGDIGGKLEIIANADLVYDGEGKPVSVVNTLGVEESEYTITYKYKYGTTWLGTSEPIRVGAYKAVLNYQDYSIEIEFEIEEPVVTPDPDVTPDQTPATTPENKETKDNEINVAQCVVSGLVGVMLTCIVWLVVEIIKKKKVK